MKSVIIPGLLCLCIYLSAPLPGAADRFYVGAYHAPHRAGLTLTTGDRQGFALFLEIEKGGESVSGYDNNFLIKRIGPNSGDGGYARLEFDPSLPFKKGDDTPVLDKNLPSDSIIWEWSKVSAQKVIGRITVDADVTLYINFYEPWNYRNIYDAMGNHVSGRCDDFNFYYISSPTGVADNSGDNFRMRYRVDRGRSILFNAEITRELYERVSILPRIEARLLTKQSQYEANRVKIEGAYQNLPAAVSHNLNWLVLLQPDIPSLYAATGRRLIHPGPDSLRDKWTIFPWAGFFSALGLSLDSIDLAADTLRSLINTQYDSGNIPNWRSPASGTPDRAQPPVGAFVALKIYHRFQNRSLLEWLYPHLKKFNFFWTDRVSTGFSRRDGNDNGLLEWGSDGETEELWLPDFEKNASGRERSLMESGQTDLPNYEGVKYNPATWTLEMDCVDLNALFALDNECLAIIANILDKEDDEKIFIERYLRVKHLMNEKMWDAGNGVYRDRRWSGKLSQRLAASNFYPLIAGIPDAGRARQMVKILTDNEWFWGEYVLPTISRKNPAFVDQPPERVTIRPPVNYLIHQGLLRYNLFTYAAKLSQKSLELLQESWDRRQLCREYYFSDSGDGGGNRYHSLGMMLSLMGLDEYISWDISGELKLGSFYDGDETSLTLSQNNAHNYRVTMSNNLCRIEVDQSIKLTASAPMVAKNLQIISNGMSFLLFTQRDTRIQFSGLSGNTFNISINGRLYLNSAPEFRVPQGRHQIRIGPSGS